MKNEENKGDSMGSRIKQAREEAGYPQVALAKALDFDSATAISLIENGERKLTAENLNKIANFLHRDIAFFLGRDNEAIKMDLSYALRAAKDISNQDKEVIQGVIDLARKRRKKNARKL
jgi:transcriptional regulator with XRE-family HTH domain